MSDPRFTIISADTRVLALPLVEPFAAAHGTVTTRRLTVVELRTSQGPGWGECVALPDAGYSDETADGAFDVLTAPGGLIETLAAVMDRYSEAGEDAMDNEAITAAAVDAAVAGPISRLRSVGGDHASPGTPPMAVAALEMALLDAVLRARSQSLADHLADRAGGGVADSAGLVPETVPAGVAVGLGTVAATTDRVVELVEAGYRRVKLKIVPDHDVDLVAEVGRRVAGAPVQIQVDGNGAYRSAHLAELLSLAADHGVAAIEQPFPAADTDNASRLVQAIDDAGGSTAVVADEGAGSVAALSALIAARAATGVSIKPGRVGGLSAALAMRRRALDGGLALTAGGMVESGLGRHALAAVAALPGFDLIGDLSPAARWLRHDPWPDLTMVDGRIAVPTGPGVGPDPDPTMVEMMTVRSHHRAY